MHYLHMFATSEYSIFLIRQGQQVVHCSIIQPKYFRIPAMAEDDLEITGAWTEPDFRGNGLASYAIQGILGFYLEPDRYFWYITRRANLPSIRAAEKASLVRVGKGTRTHRLGLRILGSFVMHQRPS